MMAAALLGGCFEPLYGERSLTGGPTIRQRLSSVEIMPISAPSGTPLARIAANVRNDLIFETAGGNYSPGGDYTHRLVVNFLVQRVGIIVDVGAGAAPPNVEQYGINATFVLVEIATKNTVMSGQTFARVSFDNPSPQQRFTTSRGLRDAEDRTAKLIAENIRSRLASYFVAGT
ncbi:MAG: hypothetical protein FJX52_11225 [Alphaproteobacteria bacterium]|nr:hypothetical protein [Alphaproteobacteria bacterium]